MRNFEVMFALGDATGFGPARLMTCPNQALQHNDHGCHGLCRRTLRANHGRG
jgi:hypothetical protein